MMRHSLAARMGFAIIVLIISVVSALYVIIGQLFEDAFQGQSTEQLKTQIVQYVDMAETGGAPMIQMMTKGTEDLIVMVNKTATVVVHTPTLSYHPPDTRVKALIAQVLEGKSILTTGPNDWFGEPGVMVGAPIRSGQRVVGGVFLFRSEAVIENSIHRIQELLIVAGLGTVIFASGVTVLLSNRIAGPLEDVVRAASEFGNGNYNAHVSVQGDDEIAVVGRAMNQLARDLQDAERNRNEFLANISHELRTPLSYIRGYSQVVADGLVSDPKERERYLRLIYDETIRIELLVRDLFVLAQADAGELSVTREAVNLNELILHTVRLVEARATSKTITIETSLGGQLIVAVDRLRMEQVLLNLLENAIRYTEPSGRVTVSLTSGEQDHVQITVSDTGVGIPETDLPYIFDRLYRVDKSRNRGRGGSGLGLAIVKQIVELHGGTVRVRSVEHKGTTFTILLPALAPQSERRSKA